MYRAVTVQNPTERESRETHKPYLNVFLPGIGFAQCWLTDLWGVLYLAHSSGKPVRLDLEQDKGEDPKTGKECTYTRIVGVEHPNQMTMPGVAK